ncbi:hypothetical protein HID58_061977, partial [Brassica napus]
FKNRITLALFHKTLAQMPGGDRNKKPQEEEEEEVKTSFAHIPYDLTEHCLAITPRRHYPNLSLASKSFRRILRSPELYQRRSTLGVTKPVLYASIGFPSSETPSWHTLHRDHVSFRLRKIASLPSRLLSAVATVGTEMHVLGGSVGGNPTSDVNLIDCRFHTSRSLPSMKRTRSRAVAGAIDGKIFVLDPSATCLVFDPSVGALVEWDDGGELMSLWQASSCMAKVKRWKPVYGVNLRRDLLPFSSYYDSKMANLGNNPWPIFHYGRQDVWCVEIALERHGDETFGRVESTMLLSVSHSLLTDLTRRWLKFPAAAMQTRNRKKSQLLSAVATIGTEMYVLGGSVGGNATSNVTLIDCRFRTSQPFPSMRRARSRAVAGAIGGKIYVIGGCRKKSDDWVEVFDVKARSWRVVPGVLPHAHWEGQFVTCAVMDDKIFVLDPTTCLVFDPIVGALVEWDDGVEMRSLWQASSCVVDDMLYTVDPGCSLKHPIVVYDPKAKERRWRPVCGVDLRRDLPPFDSWYDSKMANLGGKLVILVGSNPWPCFHHGTEEIWCVEIALERQGDDIWGHVESTTLVLTSRKWPSIELSRTVKDLSLLI